MTPLPDPVADSAVARGDSPARVAVHTAPRGRRRIKAFILLTKPRIIELLLVTAVPTMFLAARGVPDLWTVLWVLVGGTLSAGGANALNSYLDRDIDALMERTAHRPLVVGDVSPRAALIFGLVLSVASTVLLAVTTNLLAAALSALAIIFYVAGYTLLLKRRTAQNIVWGGAAGCMPILIAWAAVRGSLDWAPVVLFLIVFWWTPPHYWPLALRYRDDYDAAGVPMLPVVADRRTVCRQILIYGWVMVATSLLLVPVAPMGPLYSAAAIVLGAVFLLEAYRLRARVRSAAEDLRPMRLFHYSISYLALLFLCVAIDPFVTGWAL